MHRWSMMTINFDDDNQVIVAASSTTIDDWGGRDFNAARGWLMVGEEATMRERSFRNKVRPFFKNMFNCCIDMDMGWGDKTGNRNRDHPYSIDWGYGTGLPIGTLVRIFEPWCQYIQSGRKTRCNRDKFATIASVKQARWNKSKWACFKGIAPYHTSSQNRILDPSPISNRNVYI